MSSNTTYYSAMAGANSASHPRNPLSSSLGAFLSSANNMAWLQFIIAGLLLELYRRMGIVQAICDLVLEHFSVRATFRQSDPSYNWVVAWLENHPSWNRRNVDIQTTSDIDPEAFAPSGLRFSNLRKMSYLPPIAGTIFTSFQGHIMAVSRMQEQSSVWEGKQSTVSIWILTRDPNILAKFIKSVQMTYLSAHQQTTAIHIGDTAIRGWKLATTSTKPKANSLVTEPGLVDGMIADLGEFLRSKEWYLRRSIPYRRGYLMHGPPGCGKTSTIRLLAGHFDLDIYVISLSMSGMDDTLLGGLLTALPVRCIATIEDIDVALSHGVNREEGDNDTENPFSTSQCKSRVTLSGLLNALDGVGAQEGRIIIATTNKYHALDPALIRPGRMDVHLEFKNATKYQAGELFTRFYLPQTVEKEADSLPVADADSVAVASGLAMSSLHASDVDAITEKPSCMDTFQPDEAIQGLAIQFTRAAVEKEADFLPVADADSVAVASGLAMQSLHASDVDAITEKPSCIDTFQPDEEAIQELAIQFARAIPECELSMASLQGYLLLYKTRPQDAVQNVDKWVNNTRKIQTARENMSTSSNTKSAPPLTPASSPVHPATDVGATGA